MVVAAVLVIAVDVRPAACMCARSLVYVVLGARAVAGVARVGHPRHDRRRHPRPADPDAAGPPARADRRRRADRPLVGRGGPPHDGRSPAVGLGGRVARAPPAPVDELRHRPAVRPRQRRRADHRRGAVRRAVVADHLRRSSSGSSSASSSASPLFTWAGRARSASACCRAGATWRGIVGIGALAGIGFTVSLFVTGLAFDDVALQDEAKIGILVASTIAAVVGSVILLGGGRPRERARDR